MDGVRLCYLNNQSTLTLPTATPPPTQLVHVNDHMNSPLRVIVACAGPAPSAGPRADRGSCGRLRRRCAEDRFKAVRPRCRTPASGR